VIYAAGTVMATGCDGENSEHELWQQTGRFSKADQAAFLSDHRSAPDRAVEDVGAAARLMAWILIMSRHTRTVYVAVDGTIVGRTPALYRRSPGKRQVRGGPLHEG
jgi:hypothetical protein